MDAFRFTYEHVDCLYTIFEYRFSYKILVKNDRVFDNVQTAVFFKQKFKRLYRIPSITKMELLKKNYWRPLLSSCQKTKSTRFSITVFAVRIDPAKNTKYELVLIKIVDWLLDGYGDYTSNIITFEIKSLKPSHFWITKIPVILKCWRKWKKPPQPSSVQQQ